jgi:hypothetical protein
VPVPGLKYPVIFKVYVVHNPPIIGIYTIIVPTSAHRYIETILCTVTSYIFSTNYEAIFREVKYNCWIHENV